MEFLAIFLLMLSVQSTSALRLNAYGKEAMVRPVLPVASLLNDNLLAFKSQEEGWNYADLQKATESKDPWGAIAGLPSLEKLQGLDKNGDGIVSEKEMLNFRGLSNDFCRNSAERQYGCKERCTAGDASMNGTFAYLQEKGTTTFQFSPETTDYVINLPDNIRSQGAVSPAQSQALAMGIKEVVQNGVEGGICEFGVHDGGTSIYFRQLLDDLKASKSHPLHLYDSFQGLPNCTKEDTGMCQSPFMMSAEIVRNAFTHLEYQVPSIHKGWFNEIPDSEFPEKIAFAFIDGDLYQSQFTALQRVWPRLSKGGIVIMHDYASLDYPGTELAADDFLQGRNLGFFNPAGGAKVEKVQLIGGRDGVTCDLGMIRKE